MFGAWMQAIGGRLAHYVLGGKALCGAESAMKPINASGGIFNAFDVLGKRKPGGKPTPCPACRKANVERWAGRKDNDTSTN